MRPTNLPYLLLLQSGLRRLLFQRTTIHSKVAFTAKSHLRTTFLCVVPQAKDPPHYSTGNPFALSVCPLSSLLQSPLSIIIFPDCFLSFITHQLLFTLAGHLRKLPLTHSVMAL